MQQDEKGRPCVQAWHELGKAEEQVAGPSIDVLDKRIFDSTDGEERGERWVWGQVRGLLLRLAAPRSGTICSCLHGLLDVHTLRGRRLGRAPRRAGWRKLIVSLVGRQQTWREAILDLPSTPEHVLLQ